MSQTSSIFLVLTLLSVGCQQDGSIGGDGVIAGLTQTDPGTTPTAAGETAIVWSVSSGSPDYDYIAGQGTLSSTGFEISLPTAMPAAAVNSYGVGIGVIAAWADNAPPDGRISDEESDAFESRIIGATERHAIIYIAPDAVDELGWTTAFPDGFSCGVGVAAESGFDSYEPIDCDLMQLRIGNLDDFDFVNWT